MSTTVDHNWYDRCEHASWTQWLYIILHYYIYYIQPLEGIYAMVRILQHYIYLIWICPASVTYLFWRTTFLCLQWKNVVNNNKQLLLQQSFYYIRSKTQANTIIISFISYLCWFALFHVWFWLSSTLFDLSVRLGCFFPVVFLLGVVTSGPDNRPSDSLILDLWPSPEAFWLSLAFAFSLPGLKKTKHFFFIYIWLRHIFASCNLQLVFHSVFHSADAILKSYFSNILNKPTRKLPSCPCAPL